MQYDFGDALVLMQDGRSVKREGWNGKRQYVYLAPASVVDEITWCAHFVMVTEQGQHVRGWIPSQTDLLAHDWVCITPQVQSRECQQASGLLRGGV